MSKQLVAISQNVLVQVNEDGTSDDTWSGNVIAVLCDPDKLGAIVYLVTQPQGPPCWIGKSQIKHAGVGPLRTTEA